MIVSSTMANLSMAENKPLRNAPIFGLLLGEDPQEIQKDLSGKGEKLRISGNLGLPNFLDDSLFNGERSIFGLSLKE
jgi:hypothetical protein